MQKYHIYPNAINFENLIEINKILKVNIIVYDKLYNTVYGFCQDNVDCNVFKSYSPNVQYDFQSKYIGTMQSIFPNFAAFSKDISAIYKISTVNTAKIGVDIYDYRGPYNEYAFRFGVKAFRSTIVEEERPCYDVAPFHLKMNDILAEMGNLPNSEVYTDITSIPEFNSALSVTAAKGIQTVKLNNNIYFVAPTFINFKKDEKVDLICKNNFPMGTKILNYKIYKKNGVVNVIYRQILL